jgi:hypothetical protein
MQYFVNFKKPGTYYVWVRAHVDSGTSDSIHVGRDGQMLSSADRISSPTFGSWVWVRSTLDGTGARLNISSPGLHTIHVWMREDGFRLDRILLTTSSSYVPRGAGPQESPRQ